MITTMFLAFLVGVAVASLMERSSEMSCGGA